MKELQIDLNAGMFSTGTTRKYTISDDATADAAYAAVKAAMDAYREHGNDRDKTVEIDIGIEGKSTIKVSVILGVTIFSVATEENIEMTVAAHRYDKKVKDRLKAEGLWEGDKSGA